LVREERDKGDSPGGVHRAAQTVPILLRDKDTFDRPKNPSDRQSPKDNAGAYPLATSAKEVVASQKVCLGRKEKDGAQKREAGGALSFTSLTFKREGKKRSR